MKLFRLLMTVAIASTLLAPLASAAEADPDGAPFRAMVQDDGDLVEWHLEWAPEGCTTEDGAIEFDRRSGAPSRRACLVVDKEEGWIVLLWSDGEFQQTSPLEWVVP